MRRSPPPIGFRAREDHPPARGRAPASAQRGGRHLRRRAPRPPRGDPRLRQRADVRPPPGLGGRAPARAEAAHDASSEGRADRRAGRAGADRDPLRRRLRRAQRAGVHRRGARRRARGACGSRSARTSASATARRATRSCWPPTGASRRSCTRCWRWTGRSSPPATSAVWCWPARWIRPTRLLGAPFQLRGEVVRGDERGRELGFPTANLIPEEALVCPGHGIYACLAATGRPGRRQHRRAPDLHHRPRRADRGVPARLRRRPLRQRAAPGLPRAACAASGASPPPRRWSSRCTATSSRRARCSPSREHVPSRSAPPAGAAPNARYLTAAAPSIAAHRARSATVCHRR